MLGDLLLDHATLATFVLENFAPPRGPTDRTVKLKKRRAKKNYDVEVRKGGWVRRQSSPGRPETLSISTCSPGAAKVRLCSPRHHVRVPHRFPPAIVSVRLQKSPF